MKIFFKSMLMVGLLEFVGSMVFAQGGQEGRAVNVPGQVNYTWNQMHTGIYEGMIAETVTMQGFAGDRIRAYFSHLKAIFLYHIIFIKEQI